MTNKLVKQQDVNNAVSQSVEEVSKERPKSRVGQNEPVEFLLYQSPIGGVKKAQVPFWNIWEKLVRFTQPSTMRKT